MTLMLWDYHNIGLTLLVGLALAIGVLFLFSWLAEEVFEGDTQKFDEAMRAAINRHASPPMWATFATVRGVQRSKLLMATATRCR
jgi:predicted RND superfamily exporter protein